MLLKDVLQKTTGFTGKIRVGLLVDELTQPSWVYKMIEKINADGYAEIVLIVKRKTPSLKKRSFIKEVQYKSRSGLIGLYTRFERLIYKPEINAFEEKNINTLISAADLIEVDCIEKRYSDYFRDEDIATIREYKIDVFLLLGFRILRGKILKSASLGVWSYHHGDNFVYRGGPAGFWEFLKKDKEVGAVLQILTEDLDGGEVMYRSWSSVSNLHNKTLNSFFWKTSLFVPRKLRELHEMGRTAFLEKVRCENSKLTFYSDRIYSVPTNIQFLKLFLPSLFQGVAGKIRKIFHFEQWILLYSNNSTGGPATSMYKYRKIMPPKDRYWADPCVIYDHGKHYVFFEEVLHEGKKERGRICAAEIDKNGFQSEPVVILEKPYHLSYPFVFKHNGQYYMIPESQENSTIELYKATGFPFKWEFQMNLMENVKAVDATVFYKDNKFWLFANMKEIDGVSSSEELFLFFSENLLSNKWHSHPRNPVVSDVKSSRPAGRIFYHNEKLYRPSQDCSLRYGYSTVINEIRELNEKNYKEEKISAILPNWDNKIIATHTLSFDHGLSMIDAKIRRRKKWIVV